MLRHEWQSRIKSVESEYKSMRQASEFFKEKVRVDTSILEVGSEYRHILTACDNLEATYLIRLFAEFETGLRQYWATQRPTKPNVTDLLKGSAARQRIPSTELQLADSVRKFRNSLVHEPEESVEPISLAVARGYLCRYLSYLPPQW